MTHEPTGTGGGNDFADRPELPDDAEIELYALDALDPEETALVERRLDEADPGTRAELDRRIADARLAAAALTEGEVAPEEPPAGLRAAILDSLPDSARAPVSRNDIASLVRDRGERDDGDRVGGPHSGTPHLRAVGPDTGRSGAPPPRPRGLRVLGAVAAAVVLLAGGVAVGRWTAPDDGSTGDTGTSELASAPDLRVTRADLGGDRVATVLSSRAGDTALVHTEGFRAPGPARGYEVWLMPAAGAPRPAGMMSAAGANGYAARTAELADARAVAVTEEPAAGSPQPTGPVLARIDLP